MTKRSKTPAPNGPSALDFLSRKFPAEPEALAVDAPTAMTAEALIEALTARGAHLRYEDGQLQSDLSLTDDEALALIAHYGALRTLVAAPDSLPPPPPSRITVGPERRARAAPAALDEPPELTGIDTVVLNLATTGVNWAAGDRPIGATVSTLDGELVRFLPFGFAEGNHDPATIKRWAHEQLRDKTIVNANTRFEVHHLREWGVDLEAQGCRVSDVMHYAALLDDHRRRFAVDVLIKDYLPDLPTVPRVDETMHRLYASWDVAERERYTARMTAKLREVMWPRLDAEDLQRVRALEDEVIYPLVEMEKNGALLDEALLDQYQRECTIEHDRVMREVVAEAGFGFTHTSSGWHKLFEKCGLTPRDSYAEHVILSVDHPLIRKAYYAGQIASLNSKTFAAYKKNLRDGILRYDINQLRGDDGGTVSGRLSIGYVQQVPNSDNHFTIFEDRWFPRRLFIPKTGQYLEADAAQIEYRLFAHFANNPKVLQAYRDNPWLSFHKMTWAEMKKYKPDLLYTHMKSFNFARQYGAKMMKLATMMGFITAAQAEEIKQERRWHDPRLTQIKEIELAYNRFMPEGGMLLDRASHLAKPFCDDFCTPGDYLHRNYKHRGYVVTIEGRRSRFPDGFRTYIGLNRVIQGSGADIMKRKMVELHKARKQTGFLMRLSVHDAVGGDAQEPDTMAKVSAILNAQSYDLRVPILWETKQGPNWADAKKEEAA